MKNNRPFEVGEEVVLVASGWGRYIHSKRKVAKFHKNGNFVLEGDTQQYKLDGHAAGEGRYRLPHCVHTDDEQVKEIEMEQSFRDARGELESVIGELRRGVSPSMNAIKKMRKAAKLIREIVDSDNQPEDFEKLDT